MYVCKHIHTYIHTYLHAYTHTRVRTYIQTNIQHTHTYIHAYIHTYRYVYVYTDTHTHLRPCYTVSCILTQACIDAAKLHKRENKKSAPRDTHAHELDTKY